MKAIVWTKENCGQCLQAKNMLKLRGIDYEERMIGMGWTKEDLLEAVPDARSVPQIFFDGQLVGGFIELKERLQNVN